MLLAVLVWIAFAVKLWREAPKVRQISGILIQVRKRHCVLLTDLPVKLCLQSWPLVIREGQREQGFRLTHKLVHVALSSHLRGRYETNAAGTQAALANAPQQRRRLAKTCGCSSPSP